MRRFAMLFALLSAFVAPPALAAEKVVDIKVKGLVCEFCVKGIRHNFGEVEEVKSVDVNLDTAIVTLTLKDGTTLSDEAINQTIEDSGYEVEKISRK